MITRWRCRKPTGTKPRKRANGNQGNHRVCSNDRKHPQRGKGRERTGAQPASQQCPTLCHRRDYPKSPLRHRETGRRSDGNAEEHRGRRAAKHVDNRTEMLSLLESINTLLHSSTPVHNLGKGETQKGVPGKKTKPRTV